MSNTIRTFIAVELHPETQQAIRNIQDHLKKLDCNIKWVQPENIHLTLKFLGDVKLKNIDQLKETLINHLSGTKPIETELTQLGAFPRIDAPRIIWIGLKDDDQRIVYLANLLEKTLGNIGYKKSDKPFSPHITLGRTRSPRNQKTLSQEIQDYSVQSEYKETIQRVLLIKSTLTSSGPVYETLCNIQLN